jgi:hypothetical protein
MDTLTKLFQAKRQAFMDSMPVEAKAAYEAANSNLALRMSAPAPHAPTVKPAAKVEKPEDQIVVSPDGTWALSLSRFMAMWERA